jgi:hypothetical protein
VFPFSPGRDYSDEVNAGPILWARQFPYRGGHVLVVRLGNGWRLDLNGREVSARSLVSAFEEARLRPCGNPEIQVVLAALAYNERHSPSAAA